MSSLAFNLVSGPDGDDVMEEAKSRVACLTHLRNDLKRAVEANEHSDRLAFQQLLTRSQFVLEADDDSLAARIKTSRPTISRWIRGETSPHPIAMTAVYETLVSWLDERLKSHRSLVKKGSLPDEVLEF